MKLTFVCWPSVRRCHTASKMDPTTQLSDQQWLLIASLFPWKPPTRVGGRPKALPRDGLEGILWILRTGARWKDLRFIGTLGGWCLKKADMLNSNRVVLGDTNPERREQHVRGSVLSSDGFAGLLDRRCVGVWRRRDRSLGRTAAGVVAVSKLSQPSGACSRTQAAELERHTVCRKAGC